MSNFTLIDPVTIVFCLLAHMALGYAWFSPKLFANRWLALTGADTMKKKNAMPFCIFLSMVSGLGLAITLSMLFTGMPTSAALIGTAILWMAFSSLPAATSSAYANRSMVLWAIESGYVLISMLLMSLIIMSR